MKLMRIGDTGSERPAIAVDDDHYVDVSDVVDDYDEAFFRSGQLRQLGALFEERVARGEARPHRGERIGSPIARPHQIICVGLNYADHAAESAMAVPDEPVLFTKSPNSMGGPYDDVPIPPGSVATDWEVELGVVIGTRCRYLRTLEHARSHIAGYVLVNDVSERDYQLSRGGQWSKGKSCEGFNPTGPWLVTPDELPPIDELDLWLDVNGQARQRGATRSMIADPVALVHYVSQFMVLEPGDLINTGTPAGVGLGMSPPSYLRHGDIVELGITGLGKQRQRFVQARR